MVYSSELTSPPAVWDSERIETAQLASAPALSGRGPVNRARPGTGLRTPMANSSPVAATSRANVGRDGCRAPDS